MAPFTNAFQRLSLIGRKKDERSVSEPVASPRSDAQSSLPADLASSGKDGGEDSCHLHGGKQVTDGRPQPRIDDDPARPNKQKMPCDPYSGPCLKTAAELKQSKPNADTDADSINTFLRPDNLLMGDVNIKMDQIKPYLVGNRLMREIPIRDTSKVLNDRELRCLHWVIGESVERHAERTARYFANLFRSRELTDVIIYVGDHKVKTHKLVLAAFSPRFNKQFTKERPEKMLMPEVCIDVSQLQTRALLRCVEYMYKGSTEVHHYNAAEVLNVAQSLKIFSLAQICKDKLKSLQFSDLLPKPPSCKEDAAVGALARARNDEETRLKRLKGVKSCESVEPPKEEEPDEEKTEEVKREEEAKAVSEGSLDFYKITSQSTFLAWPIETVEALFNNNNISINSELDIVDAMIRWIQFRPDQRKVFAERLLDCIRFVHTTPHEMFDCKRLIPELFDLGPLRTRMAKAKWTKDLIERGVAPMDIVIPPCRVNRNSYWVETDPCETPIDNIYGEVLLKEGKQPFVPGSVRPQGGQAARTMVSKKCRQIFCDQIENEGRSCLNPQPKQFITQ